MKRKKVILYNPESVFFDMPLALLAIGSALDSSKYEVCIIDTRVEKNPWEMIKGHLDEAICFGVTVLTGSPLKDAIEICKKVKEASPSLPVVWGGWHTSLFPKQPLQDQTSVDITVQGQGEITFQELVAALDKGAPLNEIKGICFRSPDNDEIIKTPPRNITDLNQMPKINYDLIEVEEYFNKKGNRQLDFISSVGCFFRCSFCADPFVYNRRFSSYNPQRLADDIELLYRKYEFNDLNFQDETFFTYPKKINEFAEELIKRKVNITWAATMRADQGFRMTDTEWKTLKKSGLRRLLIGVESGSQEMMDWLKKDIKIEKVLHCADQCKKYKIDVIFPFIVGFPDESDESINATIQFVKKLKSMSRGFRTEIFYFKPYPGSEITTNVVKAGYQLPVTTEEWAEFDYIGSSGPWVSNSKYKFFERFKFYLKLAWGKRHPLLIPFHLIAKLRCRFNFFTLPVEKYLFEKIRPAQKLS